MYLIFLFSILTIFSGCGLQPSVQLNRRVLETKVVDPPDTPDAVAYKYSPVELSFESQTDYGSAGGIDPFDYRTALVYLELYEPGSSEVLRDADEMSKKFLAFWDGGKVWKVRLNLWKEGAWRYVLRNTMGDKSLSGKTGRILVQSPLANNEMSRRGGILKFDKIKACLTYSDGTPFFWLADTWWSFPIGFNEKFLGEILAKRKKQKFTAVQTHFFHLKMNGVSGLDAVNPSLSSSIEYWRNLDSFISKIHDSGLVILLGYGSYSSFQSPTFDLEKAKRMFHYSLARYGANATSYLITQEYNQLYKKPDSAGKCGAGNYPHNGHCYYETSLLNKRLGAINEIGTLLRNSDPYGRALTVHTAIWNHDKDLHPAWNYPWVDYLTLQAGHRRWTSPQEYYGRNYPKVYFEAEANWEGFASYKDPSNPTKPISHQFQPGEVLDPTRVLFNSTPTVVTQTAATAFQGGAKGFSYGAQGLYGSIEDIYKPANTGAWGPIVTMYEAMNFAGANRLQFVRQAYEMVEWWKLKPVTNRLFDIATGSPQSKVSVAGYNEASKEDYVFLYPALDKGVSPMLFKVSTPKGTKYKVTGVSPRSGLYWTGPVVVTTKADGTLTIAGTEKQPVKNDYLLVVQRVQ